MMSSSFFAAAPVAVRASDQEARGPIRCVFSSNRRVSRGWDRGAARRARAVATRRGDGRRRSRARARGGRATRGRAVRAKPGARARARHRRRGHSASAPRRARLPRREEKPSSFFKRRSGRPIDRSSKTTTRYDPSAGVFASRARPLSVRDPVVRAPRLSRARGGRLCVARARHATRLIAVGGLG